MIPSQWHFLRKVGSSDPRRHPGPAGNESPGPPLGREGKARGRREHKTGMFSEGDKTGFIAPLCLHLSPEYPMEPVRRSRV